MTIPYFSGKELVSQAGSLKTKLLAVGTKLVEPLLESNAHLKEVEGEFLLIENLFSLNYHCYNYR